MNRFLFVGAIAASVVGIAWPGAAMATRYLYVLTGTTYDPNSYYDANLPIGEDFTITFAVEDASPKAIYAPDFSSATGGGAVQEGTTPPVVANFQMDGYQHKIRQGNFEQPYYYDPDTGDPSGTTISERDEGSIYKTETHMSISVNYTYYTACCGLFNTYTSDFDTLYLYFQGNFGSADFREAGTFDLTAIGGSFQTGIFSGGYHDPGSFSGDFVGLRPTTLTVSLLPVPETSAWAMMILGLGFVGGALRARREGSKLAWT